MYVIEENRLKSVFCSFEMTLISFSFLIGISSSNVATCGLGAVQVQQENLQNWFLLSPNILKL